MNREKKEKLRKYYETRKGKSKKEIAVLDLADEISERVKALCRQFHSERFPEESDYMLDSNADVKDRKRGINPMSAEYIEKVRRKRAQLGVSQLGVDGMPVSSDSMELCQEEAKQQIYTEMGLEFRNTGNGIQLTDKAIENYILKLNL
jgi:hypothetical protein